MAPAPPTASGVAKEGLVRVTQTTAPAKESKPHPLQTLDTSYKDMEMLEQIDLKTDLARGFMNVFRAYEEKDKLGFKKHATKFGELLITLSDYEEVPHLLSDKAVQSFKTTLGFFEERDYKGAQNTLSSFSKTSDELNAWAGSLKIAAIALGK